jgi:pimeloyl-ACP methyl ester carboxylesterase
MSAEPIRTEFVEGNGIRFEVNMCGDGEKLALFLHGFPQTNYSWRHQMPALARLGYRAWAPNQRGYGNSTCPPNVKDYAIETLMGDVAALIDASGCKSTTLIAHDWGALVAWHFLSRKIRPIERAVIMNVPHPMLYRRTLRSHPRQILRSWYVMFFTIPWLPETMLRAFNGKMLARSISSMAIDKSIFSGEDLDVYRENIVRPGRARGMINWYRDLVRGGMKRQVKLGFPGIDVPVLVIWGVEDKAISIETTYGMEEIVADLTVRYLQNVSHWVPEDAPEVVNTMIEAWLTGEPVPEAGPDGRTIAGGSGGAA